MKTQFFLATFLLMYSSAFADDAHTRARVRLAYPTATGSYEFHDVEAGSREHLEFLKAHGPNKVQSLAHFGAYEYPSDEKGTPKTAGQPGATHVTRTGWWTEYDKKYDVPDDKGGQKEQETRHRLETNNNGAGAYSPETSLWKGRAGYYADADGNLREKGTGKLITTIDGMPVRRPAPVIQQFGARK